MHPSILALLVLFVAVAVGCDSGAVVDPYAGVIVVSLAPTADEPALQLLAESDTGCNRPLRVRIEEASAQRLQVRVLGIERPRGSECRGIIPARALIRLPFREQGTFPVLVTHAGATDEYRYGLGFAGVTFEAIRTSTTRLGD